MMMIAAEGKDLLSVNYKINMVSTYVKRDTGDKENSFNTQTAGGRHAKDFID